MSFETFSDDTHTKPLQSKCGIVMLTYAWSTCIHVELVVQVLFFLSYRHCFFVFGYVLGMASRNCEVQD